MIILNEGTILINSYFNFVHVGLIKKITTIYIKVNLKFRIRTFFSFSYKHMSGSSQYKFGVLAKIVKHLKNLHQDGADHALTLEEILDETNQLDVGVKITQVSNEIEFHIKAP